MQIVRGNMSGRIRVYASLLGTYKVNFGGSVYKLNDPSLRVHLINKEESRSAWVMMFAALVFVCALFLVGPFALLTLPLFFAGKRVQATVEFVLPDARRFLAIADKNEWAILSRFVSR